MQPILDYSIKSMKRTSNYKKPNFQKFKVLGKM